MAIEPRPPIPPASSADGGTRIPGAPRQYRPTMVLQFQIRLEDFSNEDGPNAVGGKVPLKQPRTSIQSEALPGLEAAQAENRAAGRTDVALDVTVQQERDRATRAVDVPQSAAPENVDPDDLVVKLYVVPTQIDIEANGFRIADKLNATVALNDLPIDPRIVRSVLVNGWITTVGVDDFADKARWVPKVIRAGNPMFRGYVDVHGIDVDETNNEIAIDAVSLEQQLMIAELDARSTIRQIKGGEEPLVDFVKRAISTVPGFSGAVGDVIGVELFPNFDKDKAPTVGKRLLLRTMQSAKSQAKGNGGNVEADDSSAGTDPGSVPGKGVAEIPKPTVAKSTVWDLITRACEMAAGLIPIYDPSIDPNAILLMAPQNLMETPTGGVKVSQVTDPRLRFNRQYTRPDGSTWESTARIMVYGGNIKSMKINRNFGRIKAPGVRVVSYNPDAPPKERRLEALFPITAKGSWVQSAGTGRKRGGKGHPPVNEIETYVIHGVRDLPVLKLIATSLYNSLARKEFTIAIETDDLSSWIDPANPESGNENPDLLRLRPGMAVQVKVARNTGNEKQDRGFVVNDLSDLFRRHGDPQFLRSMLSGNRSALISEGARVKLDQALGRIEEAYQRAKLQDFFYVRVVRFRLSWVEGFSCAMELINYLEARALPANLSPEDKAAQDVLKEVKQGDTAPDPGQRARDQAFPEFLKKVL